MLPPHGDHDQQGPGGRTSGPADPDSGGEGRPERRGLPRLACGPFDSPNPAGAEEGSAVLVRDFSPAGIGLLAGRRFEPGCLLRVEAAAGDRPPLTVWARVVHLQPLPQGGWLTGCEHVQPVSAEEFRAFLSAFAPLKGWASGAGDTRVTVRDYPAPLAVCAWCKRVRGGEDLWLPAEDRLPPWLAYRLTHGICADCSARFLRGG